MNNAYAIFINKIGNIFDKTCPLIQIKLGGKVNACRKKRQLYFEKIRKPSEVSVNRYKSYRNKLTTILRSAEKNYYSDLLDAHKNNVKEMWKI